MNENQKEKTYWDEWAEEGKKMAFVFDGSTYWMARLRDNTGNDRIFDLETKLEETVVAGPYYINGKRYKEVSNV